MISQIASGGNSRPKIDVFNDFFYSAFSVDFANGGIIGTGKKCSTAR
jgi:hypothetical protein